MKNRLLRALGIGAALAMPIAGFAALGSTTAGAVPNGLYNSMWQFTFSAAGGVTTVLCTTVTLQIATNQNTNMVQKLCTVKTGGGHYGGIGTATAINLLITPNGLLFMTSTTKATLKNPNFSIKVTFETLTCTIKFKSTIPLTRTHSTHTKYSVTNVGLNGNATVSPPTTGVCKTIKTLLNTTPTSKFGAALKL